VLKILFKNLKDTYLYTKSMNKLALFSVSNKTDVSKFGKFLINKGYKILSTGGTYKTLVNNHGTDSIIKISDYTNFNEVLGGRVKTLHPKIHSGLLSDNTNPEHLADMVNNDYNFINIVVVNLYPFKQTVSNPDVTEDEAIENIDIGGHTLIRASSKNYKRVLIITEPSDYEYITKNWNEIDVKFRKNMAKKALHHITKYDMAISGYFNKNITYRHYTEHIPLKYGCNPHQNISSICAINDNLPIKMLNGTPGYINLLDALGSWQLVSEIEKTTGIIAAASFKHTAPAGVSINKPLTDLMKKIYGVENYDLTPCSTAFIRARNSDPMSSFGDFIAISGIVDKTTALLIKREVSDGIIAAGYTSDALDILKAKRRGRYLVIEANKSYINLENKEFREMFGITLMQKPNTMPVGKNCFENIQTEKKIIPEDSRLDMIIANITLKYTPSNSVSYATDGQVIGIGAGQQNRVDCVKLAGDKALKWILRQHPKTINLFNYFKSTTKRQEKINCCMQYINGNFSKIEFNDWLSKFNSEFEYNELTDGEKNEFIKNFHHELSLSSDAFFPFRDNIDECAKRNVKYIIQPGGSIADKRIISACNDYNIAMAMTGIRLFQH